MLRFQPQVRWNVFILCYMAWELALKQKERNAKPFSHAPLAHSSLPPRSWVFHARSLIFIFKNFII